VVTATSVPQASSSGNIQAEKKSTHNTAAIAAGVVVGVVGLAALAGAVWFFYHSKKQKAEGFRGTAGGYERESQPPSMSDSRFDGGYMAQRRQSNGSIDDDHDFSRRILQVRVYC
jgi:cell wall integrity and stress response component